jgi:predicted RNA-binding Zn-ribbon protein involved in translation (DUF1610 family)
MKPEIEEKLPYIFAHREEILNSEQESEEIVDYVSAGGLGACALSANLTLKQLLRCWEHPEMQYACHECGNTSYVYGWAASMNNGGYFVANFFCPSCGKSYEYHNHPIGCKVFDIKDIVLAEVRKDADKDK